MKLVLPKRSMQPIANPSVEMDVNVTHEPTQTNTGTEKVSAPSSPQDNHLDIQQSVTDSQN